MFTLKLTSIGTSTGVILPKELLAQMKVEKGDSLFVSEAPGGGLLVSPYDPALAEQLEAGEQIMRDYRDTFKALAK